jgi:hypothetical protein
VDEGFFKADAVNEETPSATALPHEEEEEEAEEEEGNSLFIANAEKASGKRGHVDSSQHACCKKKHVNIIQKCMLHN